MTENDDTISQAALKSDAINHLHSLAVGEKLEIRQSVAKSVFWAAGLSVAAVGWIVTNAEQVESNRLIMSLAGILFFAALAALMIRQRAYFDGVAKVIRTCDDFYGVFKVGHYVDNEALYPKEWMNFSTKHWREPIFDVSGLILFFSAVITLGAIWTVKAPVAKPAGVNKAPTIAAPTGAAAKAPAPTAAPAASIAAPSPDRGR